MGRAICFTFYWDRTLLGAAPRSAGQLSPREPFGDTPHGVHPAHVEALGVTGVTQVAEMPSDLDACEGIYYKTVGKLYTPYIINDPLVFDIGNLEEIHRAGNITCPEVDAARFERLMAYAAGQNFGLTNAEAAA